MSPLLPLPALALAAFLAAAAPPAGPKAAEDPPREATPARPGTPSKGVLDSNRILARVGREVVTTRDLVQIEMDRDRGFKMTVPVGEDERVDLDEVLPLPPEGADPMTRALERRILQLLAAEHAKAAYGDKLKESLEAYREQLLEELREKLNLAGRKALERRLESEGMPLARLLAFKEEEALIGFLVEDAAVGSEPGPADIARYLADRPARFRRPARVTFRQILLVPPLEEARRLANDLRARIDKGERFEDLAKAHSQDSRAPEGGLFGPVAEKDLDAPLAEALKSLAPGAVAGPVETRIGLHLLRLESREAEGSVPVEEVEGEIRRTLRRETIRQRLSEKFAEIRAKTPVSREGADEPKPAPAPKPPETPAPHPSTSQ